MSGGRGLFITFEGGEGTGKTTQARLLHEHLTGLSLEAVLTREPGGTRLGDRIRRLLLDPSSKGMDPVAELFLYFAARVEHAAQVIRPALERGTTVICDRFSDATLAYQGWGRGLDRRLIRRLNRLAAGGLEPDLTLLLDLEPGRGLERASLREKAGAGAAESRFEREEEAFHGRVRRGYLAIARANQERVRVIAASGGVEEVHRAVLAAVRERLPGV